MPKNQKGGTGHKKRKNKPVIKQRKLDEIAKDSNPEEKESYGKVVKAMGNRRFQVCCQDINKKGEFKTLICRLRGSYRKIVGSEDYVLVKVFDFNDNQAQIVDVYTVDEVRLLQKAGLWDYPDNIESIRDGTADDIHMTDSDSDDDNNGGANAISNHNVDESNHNVDLDIDNI